MKNRYLTLVAVTLAATTSLAACAPSAEPEPSAPTAAPATSEAPSEPTPEPTPERIEFSGATIAFADLVEAEVTDANEAVILLPSVLGASVVIEGVDAETWFVEPKFASGLGGVEVTEASPGVLTVEPIAGYDAFKDPKDFVKSADGAIIFETPEGKFTVEVEGVEH